MTNEFTTSSFFPTGIDAFVARWRSLEATTMF